MTTARLATLFMLAMLLATAATLSACGNKGPLYLPDTAQQQSDEDASKKRSKKQN